MMRMKVPKPKYIAEGFHIDAGKILEEFIDKNTAEFSEFAEIWKKHHFSLIFMGRPDHVESTEFTNEMFKISTQYLASPSFFRKVGAVYLMYALFRNQISDPSIKIRLEIGQWKIIKGLRVEATSLNYKTLHYIIDYLIKNAFIFVAHQMLKGPCSGVQTISKNYEEVTNLKANYKSDILEYSVSNNLKNLRDLHSQYSKEKDKLRDLHSQYSKEKEKLGSDFNVVPSNCSNSYELFLNDLQNIVKPSSSNKKETLGSRRAKIKAQSFIRKTQDRFGNDVEEERIESDKDTNIRTAKKKRTTRVKRVPQHERRVGRPSKNPKPQKLPEPDSDDDIDFSHLLSQQVELYLPPVENEKRKCRTRREPYYKLSPKHEGNSSDPDKP